MQCVVYVDFDGTIAPDDPTDALFDRFAAPSWRQIEDEWQSGRRSARDCMEQQVALLRATPGDLDDFLAGVSIDPGFLDFVRVCRRHSAAIVVVSDGLDRVVSTVLKAAGVDLPFYANKLCWRGGDRWQLAFPHLREDCAAGLGNCKCSHRRAGHRIREVMVGDGRSDFCIAERSDLVLAKGTLAAHCERLDLPHTRFDTFADVNAVLDVWLAKAHPRKRAHRTRTVFEPHKPEPIPSHLGSLRGK